MPIKQLQNEHQLLIANKSKILNLHLGDELSSNEEHRWFIYLIEGKLDLLEIDKPSVLLQSTDNRALHPLFIESEYKTKLIAQANSVVLRFDRQLFNMLMDKEVITSEELETVEMDEVEGSLFNEIMHDFNLGQLKLSSLPDFAEKIKKALDNTGISAEDLVRIISSDPAVAARFIKEAKGNHVNMASSVCSIASSIELLGLCTSKKIVSAMVEKEPFITQSPLLNQRMHALYDQSVDTAALSLSISRESDTTTPDHMMLAGLLSEIGVISILSYIESTGMNIDTETELEQIIDHLRSAVGSMVIKHFGLSTDLFSVVDNFESWEHQDEGEVDACDIVIIAQIYHRLKHHQVHGLPKINEVPALKKLCIKEDNAEFAKHVFQQAHEEVSSIVKLLNMC